MAAHDEIAHPHPEVVTTNPIPNTSNDNNELAEDRESGAGYDVKRIEQVYNKLDWRILPAFWSLYFLCSAIRSNIGIAQTMNQSQGHSLTQRLHLKPKQVSTGLALFYVCYVLFDLPSNLIMSRLSPRVWMCRIVTGVGIIGACFAAVEAAWSL